MILTGEVPLKSQESMILAEESAKLHLGNQHFDVKLSSEEQKRSRDITYNLWMILGILRRNIRSMRASTKRKSLILSAYF